ncbi:polyprotein [Vitis vinifera]|uniref:Polyprotein n=1 Tax=Vitis vinifera TaxID=29760 RepID=A0A438DV15_VITVI|nr:polyprotein [Vitis vinifera]
MPPSKQKPSRKPSKDKFYHSKRGTHDNYRMNDTKHSRHVQRRVNKDTQKKFDQQSPKDVSIKELHEEEQLKIAFKKSCPIPLCEETSESLFGANGKDLPLILTETGSVKIKHNADKFSNMGLAFSTCHIYKILTVKQWGGNPNFQGNFLNHLSQDESAAFPSLGRTFKTKWWDALKNDASTDAVKQYFLKNPHKSQPVMICLSFSQKAQLQAMLAAAKTPQDFRKSLMKEAQAFPKKILMQSLTIQQATFQTMLKALPESSQPKEDFGKSESYYSLFTIHYSSTGLLFMSHVGGKLGLFWVFLDYPRIGSSVPGSASPADHGFKIKPGNSPVSIITSHAHVLKVLNKLFNILMEEENWFLQSFRHSSSPRVSVYEPSRASSSSIPVRTTREEEGSSSGNPKNIKLTGVRSHTNMINTISLSDEDFEINKDLLRKDFYSEVNKQRNDWFFSTVPKVIRTIYQEEFYAYLRQEKKNIKFWIWFELFKQEEYPDYPCAALNCLQEGLVPTQFYEKTRQALFGANGKKLIIKYKLSNAHICNQGICIKQTFILVKDLKEKALLGVPFLSSIFPMWVDDQGIRTKLLDKEILFEFANPPEERSINTIKDQQHEVELPYEPDFSEKNIPTKARPIQMNKDLLSYCEKEIQDLIDKKLIRKSKSPWSCSAFYVQKQAELERGTPRLVINYKPLNDVLRWIRYPIPNKKDLLQRLVKSKVFSKFDMKSGFWQIQIAEKDRYKTAFVVPFGHYEWNILLSSIGNISISLLRLLKQWFKLVSTKINLFQTKDKKQLQHFLGSLNYVSDFIQDLSQLCAPLRQRLKKNPVPWNEDHTKIVKIVKSRVKTLPCLALADHKAFKIVETDASDIAYESIQACQMMEELLEQVMAKLLEAQIHEEPSFGAP